MDDPKEDLLVRIKDMIVVADVMRAALLAAFSESYAAKTWAEASGILKECAAALSAKPAQGRDKCFECDEELVTLCLNCNPLVQGNPPKPIPTPDEAEVIGLARWAHKLAVSASGQNIPDWDTLSDRSQAMWIREAREKLNASSRAQPDEIAVPSPPPAEAGWHYGVPIRTTMFAPKVNMYNVVMDRSGKLMVTCGKFYPLDQFQWFGRVPIPKLKPQPKES